MLCSSNQLSTDTRILGEIKIFQKIILLIIYAIKAVLQN